MTSFAKKEYKEEKSRTRRYQKAWMAEVDRLFVSKIEFRENKEANRECKQKIERKETLKVKLLSGLHSMEPIGERSSSGRSCKERDWVWTQSSKCSLFVAMASVKATIEANWKKTQSYWL